MKQIGERTGGPRRPAVWVTGLGLVSSLGEGTKAHWRALTGQAHARAQIDSERFAPYTIHPLAQIDVARQIPQNADCRQMGQWQRIGVYAAGLALADAGLKNRTDLIAKTNLNVAAGNGERDGVADGTVLAAISPCAADLQGNSGSLLNEALLGALRPTLYLSELSNLLAGNISIVHGVSGSSRTFKGEEMAGVSAVEDAVKRIEGGKVELILVGGACNSERADAMLNNEICGVQWRGRHRSVWERAANGGGLIAGSIGAFLVLESDTHARSRDRRPYARIASVISGRCNTADNEELTRTSALASLEKMQPNLAAGPLAVISGASGVASSTELELAWLESLRCRRIEPSIRAFGTVLGHATEAHYPAGVALAALAISKGQYYAPFDATGHERPFTQRLKQVLVTAFGRARGMGLGLLEAATLH